MPLTTRAKHPIAHRHKATQLSRTKIQAQVPAKLPSPSHITHAYPDYPYCCVHEGAEQVHTMQMPLHPIQLNHLYYPQHPFHNQPSFPPANHNYMYPSRPQVIHQCSQHGQHVYPLYPAQAQPHGLYQTDMSPNPSIAPYQPPKAMLAWADSSQSQNHVYDQNNHQSINQSTNQPTNQSTNQQINQSNKQTNSSTTAQPNNKTRPSAMIYPSWWPNETASPSTEEVHQLRSAQQRQKRMSQHQHDLWKSTQVASHHCPPPTKAPTRSAINQTVKQSINQTNNRPMASSVLKPSNRQMAISDLSSNLSSAFTHSSNNQSNSQSINQSNNQTINQSNKQRNTSRSTSPRSVTSIRKHSKPAESRIASLIERDRRDYYQNAAHSNEASSMYQTNSGDASESLASLVNRLSRDSIVTTFM